jgi:cell division protein YceG involved in septum cleavage
MKTLIMCIIIAIILIHCIYYFKLDIFNMLKPMDTKNQKSKFKNQSNTQNITNQLQILNQSINELKTLNECIHNGKIDSAFS